MYREMVTLVEMCEGSKQPRRGKNITSLNPSGADALSQVCGLQISKGASTDQADPDQHGQLTRTAAHFGIVQAILGANQVFGTLSDQ